MLFSKPYFIFSTFRAAGYHKLYWASTLDKYLSSSQSLCNSNTVPTIKHERGQCTMFLFQQTFKAFGLLFGIYFLDSYQCNLMQYLL